MENVPQKAVELHGKATDLAMEGKLKASLRLLNQAIAIAPEFAEAYMNRADVLEALGLPVEAQADRQRARLLMPDIRVTKKLGLRQFAAEVGGEFVEGARFQVDPLEFGSSPEVVVAKSEGWTVIVDAYAPFGEEAGERHVTRMTAPYVNKDGFRFSICHKDLLGRLRKVLPMQHVDVGHPALDRDFIIKGNDRYKLGALFGNPKIRELIEAQPSARLQVIKAWFRPRALLRLQEEGEITDVERLKGRFDLVVETLRQLHRIGSASQYDPDGIR